VGRVVASMPRMRDLAEGLRNFLQLAGVTRAELLRHRRIRTRKALTLARPARDGLHVDGHPRRRPAPHPAPRRTLGVQRTTQGYIRQAEAVREGFGDVFPPLPSCSTQPLNERPTRGPIWTPQQSWRRGIYSRKSAERAGFEPAAEFCPAPA
jgi:hypothetical protein